MEKYFRELTRNIRLDHDTATAPYPPHFHDSIEVIFVLDGTETACCNGVAYRLKPGSIFLAASNTIHSYRDRSQNFEKLMLIMEPGLLMGPGAQLLRNAPYNPVWNDPERKSVIWSLIQQAYAQQNRIRKDSLILLLSTVISLLLEHMDLQKTADPGNSIRNIVDYCREHFREPISVGHLADALHLSQSHISHTFSNVLNISFPDYINGLRMNEAERLLKSTQMNITQIAVQSGFPTNRTFNRVFLKQFGVSPTVYREQLHNR